MHHIICIVSSALYFMQRIICIVFHALYSMHLYSLHFILYVCILSIVFNSCSFKVINASSNSLTRTDRPTDQQTKRQPTGRPKDNRPTDQHCQV